MRPILCIQEETDLGSRHRKLDAVRAMQDIYHDPVKSADEIEGVAVASLSFDSTVIVGQRNVYWLYNGPITFCATSLREAAAASRGTHQLLAVDITASPSGMKWCMTSMIMERLGR